MVHILKQFLAETTFITNPVLAAVSGAHAQGDQSRTVLVLDNLEEKDFCTYRHGPFNLCHMRKVVATVAKFHAVSLTYKQMLFSTFSAQKAQVKASR